VFFLQMEERLMLDTLRARIAPIPTAFLNQLRTTGLDAQGQQIKRLRAVGGEPCRDVLRRATAGEELILASFSPFEKAGPYKEYGPVFVLANDSRESVERETLEIGSDRNYLRSQFVIRAYSDREEILDATMVDASNAQAVVEEFLARPNTEFLHVRFPTYGCFACRLDRG
jgi:hypothetical protein